MDVETVEGKPLNLADALRECEPDRQVLKEAFDDMLKQLWTESIYVVEECIRVTAPSNRHLLAAYKNRILNEGNRLKRLLPNILKDFMAAQRPSSANGSSSGSRSRRSGS